MKKNIKKDKFLFAGFIPVIVPQIPQRKPLLFPAASKLSNIPRSSYIPNSREWWNEDSEQGEREKFLRNKKVQAGGIEPTENYLCSLLIKGNFFKRGESGLRSRHLS